MDRNQDSMDTIHPLLSLYIIGMTYMVHSMDGIQDLWTRFV